MEVLTHYNKSFNKIVYAQKETKNREFDTCNFINCDFSNSLFLSCLFTNCVFTSCNLSITKFNHCQLDNITFKECKLLGVNFSSCNDFLFSLKFDACILDCCSFARKKMQKTPFINSSVKDVDFSECDLTHSIFKNADLTNTIFSNTNLKSVNFLTAKNYTIDPERNSISKAKFSLEGVLGLLNKYDIKIG
ncbi:pentapeptide repeat-containing protein [Mariniflexile litorale]|uniref:Pentapeptide repeat-containing protein n=2 Tax=Mariniflexile litorale TaxID=3045158 RepID=A0AAU7EDZ3_9FLAO|nr:pentapeptide repeat-containing protein [Mariniflexile sp. KMM 9835]MDQ8213306.1 pentapeptide repeat-containing protein [Mariniflexile sp. KMM 9835]